MKKLSLFKKSLIIYSSILLLLGIIFLIYIYFTLKTYEYNQTGTFLKDTITSLDDETLKGYLKDANQDETLLSAYKKQINDKNLKFSKVDDNSFIAVLNDRTLFTIKTKVVAEKTKLGLFSYQERKVEEIIPNLSRGLIYYDITIPSNFTLIIDGKEYSDASSLENYADLDFLYINDSMPKLATYEINNLTKEASIEVKDFQNQTIELQKDKYSYTTDIRFIKADSETEAKEYLNDLLDIYEVAHNWSLFLTKDLKGAYYGLSTITQYLMEGTSISQMAYNWAHSIDITFTSKHTLKDPIWSNEKLNNFKIYSDSAFSCEIYLEKNMIVNNQEQLDIMHDYLYFLKDENNEWKLVNIKSVEEDKNE